MTNGVRGAAFFWSTLCTVFSVICSPKCQAQSDQCISGPGQFTGSLQIRPGIGCLPLTVTASSGLKDVTNIRYVFDYQGGTPRASDLTADSVFTYHKAGLYRVLQYSEQNGRPLRVCAIVQVYDTLAPELLVSGCLNRVMISIPKSAEYQYDWYVVNWGDGTNEQLDGVGPVGVHTYADGSPRSISVRGVHLYGNCGGTTRVTFRPSTPSAGPVIDRVRAVSADRLEITVRNPGGNPFRVEQRSPGGIFEQTATASEAEHPVIQMEADTTQPVCFRLVLADTCLRAGPSPEVCYVPPKPPEPPKMADSTVFMPDAFSPNQDGINDRFLPQGLLGGSLQLTVYNRWGEVVFRTGDAREGWDGYLDNQPVPTGTYSYRLDIEKPDGKRWQQRGTVVLTK
ncbi:gliding motility-associated C-terminal domain-containing protein [Larkinella bovis]|uniref:Gliding motility-associated C-terminal domain-containing protein n=1 Tax=Larkinella bovis TaxID=683041 RepID=A0ABW0I509_9BACT